MRRSFASAGAALLLVMTAPAAETLVKNDITVLLQGIDEANTQALHEELEDQITLAGEDASLEPLADDLAFFARLHLLRAGYPDAFVQWRLQGRTIFLEAQTGEQLLLGELHWEGDLVLPEEELRKYFLRPAEKREDADKDALRWVEADAEDGAELVARRLRADGYLEAACVLTKLPITPSGRQDVKLTLTAGPRYTFGVIEVEGVPAEAQAQADALVLEAGGGPFSESTLQSLERRLKEALTSRGWLDVRAVSSFQRAPGGGAVDVVVSLATSGRPVIIQVSPEAGFSRGARRVLKAGFKPLVGDHWSTDAAELSYRRLLNTGMFASLDTVVEPLTDPAVAELQVLGEETKPKTVGFEVALDTFLGLQLGLTYRDNNLWNSGRALAAAANYSLAGPTGYLSLTDPALFNTTYAGTVRLGGDFFDRYEYDRRTLAVNAEVSRQFSTRFSLSVYAALSVSSVTSELPPEWIGPDEYGYFNAGFSALLDHRNSPVLPTKGWFLSARVDYNMDAVGEGASYLRHEARAAWLLPLGEKWRLGFGGGLDSISGASWTEIPIDNRVFNGGPNSVRSFAMRELGPVTEGDTPLGGTAAIFASAELSHKIMPNLELAVFYDAGSLDLDESSRPLHYSSDFRHAVGAGLRYLLPFGPLRLDYGYNLDRRPGEDRGFLHLTAGFAF